MEKLLVHNNYCEFQYIFKSNKLYNKTIIKKLNISCIETILEIPYFIDFIPNLEFYKNKIYKKLQLLIFS